jgi:DeoR/GlpR family transcriptional regulator of sugar metabolism
MTFATKKSAVKSKLCKCSHDTALRDIDGLMEKGVLLRSAEGGRSASYKLAVPDMP